MTLIDPIRQPVPMRAAAPLPTVLALWLVGLCTAARYSKIAVPDLATMMAFVNVCHAAGIVGLVVLAARRRATNTLGT